MGGRTISGSKKITANTVDTNQIGDFVHVGNDGANSVP